MKKTSTQLTFFTEQLFQPILTKSKLSKNYPQKTEMKQIVKYTGIKKIIVSDFNLNEKCGTSNKLSWKTITAILLAKVMIISKICLTGYYDLAVTVKKELILK